MKKVTRSLVLGFALAAMAGIANADSTTSAAPDSLMDAISNWVRCVLTDRCVTTDDPGSSIIKNK